MAALWWAAQNPRRIGEHKGWFLQELHLGWLLPPVPGSAGRLDHLSPQFLDVHARSLDEPPFLLASKSSHMRPNDVVLGIVLNGDARAYPWWIMDDHHYVNDVVGGRAVVVMLCEMCSTGVAFESMVGGRRLMFDHGPHHNGTNTLIDRQTRSVWSAYLGKAIQGKLQGTSLSLLPLEQMEWSTWLQLHPTSLVLPGTLGSRTGHGSQHTIGYPLIGDRFFRTLARWDTRLPSETLVMGAITDRRQRAYPLGALRAASGVVNDEVGGVPLVVLSFQAEGSYAGLAFSRTLDGRVLTFRPGPEGPLDDQTGSLWSWEGKAVSGLLSGQSLEFVPSHVSEWYVWAAHFPDIDIWGPTEG